MQTSLRQILSTALLIAVFGGAYYALSYLDFFSSARMTREQVETQTQEFERDLVAQLDDLNAISLDGSAFEGREYASLVDITVVLESPQVHRSDPFAAL
jgi:hypothetical protein